MTEKELQERLEKVEKLFAGSTFEGERGAASSALERLREKLRGMASNDQAAEFKFSVREYYSRLLLVALLRRYGIRPYRRPRQHQQTVMAKVPRRFLDETLWPEYQSLNKVLTTFLNETTQRIIRENIHKDVREADEEDGPAMAIE